MASTEAELLHLVDRAEAGTLLAEEAQQLRAAIRRFTAAERILTSSFNAAKQLVTSTAGALQQLGLLAEQPGACCAHLRAKHWDGHGRCTSTGCGCIRFITT